MAASTALGGFLVARIYPLSACPHESNTACTADMTKPLDVGRKSHVAKQTAYQWAARHQFTGGLAGEYGDLGLRGFLCGSSKVRKAYNISNVRPVEGAEDTSLRSTKRDSTPHGSEQGMDLSLRFGGHSANLQPLKRRDLVLITCTTPLIRPLSSLAESAVASPETLIEFESQLTNLPKVGTESVRLLIGDKCDLGVSIYPDFEYNAGGKGGVGFARKESDGRIFVHFDPTTLEIPPVRFNTTKFLKLPVPPPLKIEIVSKKLEGYIEPETGKVELDFLAEFLFTIGPLYKAKPLVVGTTLTTESSQGPLRSGQGQRLDRDGRCVLAGVARVVPVDDPLLDPFLMLPTDCLAKLPATFIFSPSQA